jgi:hypothetical protein
MDIMKDIYEAYLKEEGELRTQIIALQADNNKLINDFEL